MTTNELVAYAVTAMEDKKGTEISVILQSLGGRRLFHARQRHQPEADAGNCR